MSLDIYQDSAIRVPVEKMPEAIRLLRQYASESFPEAALIADDAAFIREITYECNGWQCDLEPDGSIKDPFFSERDAISLDWLDAIAPCIESGGYVQIQTDEDGPYRKVWVDGSKCTRIAPRWDMPKMKLFAVNFTAAGEKEHVASVWALDEASAAEKVQRLADSEEVWWDVPCTLWGTPREITTSFFPGMAILWSIND